MAKTVSLSLRSNNVLTSYVKTVDRLAALQAQIKELTAQEKTLRPQVLEQLDQVGDRKSVIIAGKVRIIEPAERVSISCNLDDENAVALAERIGMKVSHRSPNYVHSQTFRAAVNAGIVPDYAIDRTVERIITVH